VSGLPEQGPGHRVRSRPRRSGPGSLGVARHGGECAVL